MIEPSARAERLSLAIELNGTEVQPDRSGALYWPEQDTLIVADLHFEKGSSYAERGVFLPPYDTRATLRALSEVCARLRPTRVISLGDAFHDLGADGRMGEAETETLMGLTRAHEWIWIAGNHDPAPPRRFGGAVRETVRLGGLFFRHEPAADPEAGEIAGHLHPCARVRRNGRSVRRKCFVSDGRRCVVPSFGAYTGGLNVKDAAFRPLFHRYVAWVIGREGVYPIAPRDLRPD
ncbi:MAG: ligase-associated DNA damage response endonuclease PdeM [Pseudomonadota bacterium]